MDSYTRRIPFPYSCGSRVGYCSTSVALYRSVSLASVRHLLLTSSFAVRPTYSGCLGARNMVCSSFPLACLLCRCRFSHNSPCSRYQRSISCLFNRP